MEAKILEIFNSIQGEGAYAGTRQVFVRFFECNMHCVWCDTPASIGDTTRNYKQKTLEDVFQSIQEEWTPATQSVSLTGGEPLLQKDFINALTPLLKQRNMPVHLETNGVLPDALAGVIGGVDVVSMDLKLPSSTKCRPYWAEHEAFLEIAKQKEVFLKTVISSQTEQEDIEKAVAVVAKVIPEALFILQPNTYDLSDGVLKKCYAFEEYCAARLKNVRILPQMHKFMKIR